jgi:hypothetical protein
MREFRPPAPYEATIYTTELGELRRTTVQGHTRDAPRVPMVRLIGPQMQPCSHTVTAKTAREVAAILLKIADEIDGKGP